MGCSCDLIFSQWGLFNFGFKYSGDYSNDNDRPVESERHWQWEMDENVSHEMLKEGGHA